ncbi:amino acid adenylation domain-containing protein [Streptomyces sp. NPDC007856]|uniref:non-ribosomal peptide synthetase n=1 Tax=Streptomyces sp. NPDC007856 TaxID=3364781 RepID=UPI0036B83CA4
MTGPVDEGAQALWMLQQLVPDIGVSNAAVAIELEGPARWWPLQEALNLLTARHRALRREFLLQDGTVVSRELPVDGIGLELDMLASDPQRIEADLRAYAARPFRLDQAPLVRVGLFTVTAQRQVLCLAAHHIIVDAASLGRLTAELGRAYLEIAENGEPSPLPEPVEVSSFDAESAREYWREHVAGFDPVAMRLDGAREPGAEPTFAGDQLERDLSPEAARGLAALRGTCKATDAIVLLACYYLLLRRHGAAADQVIGVMADTRGGREADAIGYHVATLPLRVEVADELPFVDLVARVAAALVSGLEHGRTSFETVTASSAGPVDGPAWWRSRLVRHQFNFRPEHPTHHPAGQGSRLREVATGLSRFDLELTAQPVGSRLTVKLLYSSEAHSAEFAEAFLDRLDAVLVRAAADPGCRVGDMDLRTERDRRLAEAVNRTTVHWPGPQSVLGLFSAAVQAAPHATAVVDGAHSATYRELAAAAAGWRARVEAAVNGPDAVVAIALPRGITAAAAVLGVWAAGAAYLPCDPGHPADRLLYQLDDAGCRTVIGAEYLPPACREGRVLLDAPGGPEDDAELVVGSRPGHEDCAYLIYTSGSTGRPKGVRLSHGNLANVVRHFAADLGAGPDTSTLWLTTFAFDISALELCLPLAVGGRVVVAPDEARGEPRVLAELVERERVSVVQATPTTWRLVARHLEGRLSGRTVLCGGEPLTRALADQLLRTGARVLNVYGPTETTIWSTTAPIEAGAPVTVGTPLANTWIRVLDERGRELPTGLTGELCIGGAGVAAGYHERPELTAECFRVDPELGRYYRTGDLARQRPDGTLELVGRADRQVKLRGHRIELGEVESALLQHPEVDGAAVLLLGDPSGTGSLVGYVVADDRPGLVQDVWTHASRVLPGYSVPARLVILSELPTTANGKLDTAALGRLAAAEPEQPASAEEPGDELEHTLQDLWREVLDRPGTGMQSNFFLSGGNSLLAVRLAAEAASRCGTPVTMAMVFRAPTPAAMARLIRESGQQHQADGEAELVSRVVRETVGFEIPERASFFTVGMTSALAVQVHARLQQELGRDFPVTDVFKYPTRRALAGHLARLAAAHRAQ